MTLTFFLRRTLLVFGTVAALAACSAAPQITRVQDVSASADTPYNKILIIGLFEAFDVRKRLEREIVRQLEELGVEAVASTSMMKTTTPMARETYVAMVDKVEADAVLITHMVDIESRTAIKDRRPEATYEFRPTYYYNVWDVRLTEYVEPQFLEVKSTLRLATLVYAVSSRELVWAIESKSQIVQQDDPGRDYIIFVDEAGTIVKQLSRNGLIAR